MKKIPKFYLIIDDISWLPRFLPLGLKLVQLRIKDKPEQVILEQIIEPQARMMQVRIASVSLVMCYKMRAPKRVCRSDWHWGYDAILLNTAVAKPGYPVAMATAFANAITAGRAAYQSTPVLPRDMASLSTPTVGTPFWFNN